MTLCLLPLSASCPGSGSGHCPCARLCFTRWACPKCPLQKYQLPAPLGHGPEARGHSCRQYLGVPGVLHTLVPSGEAEARPHAQGLTAVFLSMATEPQGPAADCQFPPCRVLLRGLGHIRKPLRASPSSSGKGGGWWEEDTGAPWLVPARRSPSVPSTGVAAAWLPAPPGSVPTAACPVGGAGPDIGVEALGTQDHWHGTSGMPTHTALALALGTSLTWIRSAQLPTRRSPFWGSLHSGPSACRPGRRGWGLAGPKRSVRSAGGASAPPPRPDEAGIKRVVFLQGAASEFWRRSCVHI